MRVYIPLSLCDLRAEKISARRVHALTPEAQSALDAEYGVNLDQENLEWLATLYAADDSVVRMCGKRAEGGGAAREENREGDECAVQTGKTGCADDSAAHNAQTAHDAQATRAAECAQCFRRIVAVGEVPDSWMKPADETDEVDEHEQSPDRQRSVNDLSATDAPTAVYMARSVPWEKIESIHIDEPGNEELVQRAAEGDERAFEASGDIDLLWYDVTEREFLLAELVRS